MATYKARVLMDKTGNVYKTQEGMLMMFVFTGKKPGLLCLKGQYAYQAKNPVEIVKEKLTLAESAYTDPKNWTMGEAYVWLLNNNDCYVFNVFDVINESIKDVPL